VKEEACGPPFSWAKAGRRRSPTLWKLLWIPTCSKFTNGLGDLGGRSYATVVVLQVTRFQVFETAAAKFKKIVAIAPQVSQIKAFHRPRIRRGERVQAAPLEIGPILV
jgi:hypothetical protein